ncbi:MAG: Protein of unknown function (DUF3192) [Idiomarinaceae bacterium HL-53]|nr:MAG: Protein of unknown function (DUF3192) [Idiomarinaceae bacterium HL-53]CUS49290.1 Protein of unknown function (DUF3192) [Idiomarinaceae bacterium HL-53]
MLKGFLIAIVGFIIYAVIAGSVLTFHTANPENMTWREREVFNRKYIGRLALGSEREEVLRLLGPPDLSEAVRTAEGELMVLFYRTHHVTSDGVTTRNETTPLIFRADKLIAWGDTAYRDLSG